MVFNKGKGTKRKKFDEDSQEEVKEELVEETQLDNSPLQISFGQQTPPQPVFSRTQSDTQDPSEIDSKEEEKPEESPAVKTLTRKSSVIPRQLSFVEKANGIGVTAPAELTRTVTPVSIRLDAFVAKLKEEADRQEEAAAAMLDSQKQNPASLKKMKPG